MTPGMIRAQQSGRILLVPTRKTGRREYDCTFIAAGAAKRADQTPSRWIIPADVLKASVELFDGRPCYVDHDSGWTGPKVKNLAGVTFSPEWDEESKSITGGLRLYDEDPRSPGAITGALLDQLLDDQANGLEVPPIGLSAVFFQRSEFDEQAGRSLTTDIRYVESVDVVYDAAAGGAVRAALQAIRQGVEPMPPETSTEDTPIEELVTPAHIHALSAQIQEIAASLTSVTQLVTPPPADPSPAVTTETMTGEEYTDMRLNVLEGAIHGVQDQISALTERTTVEGYGQPAVAQLYGGRTGLDQITVALDAMLEGTRPPDNIPPLTGLRELYMLLSGDYEMSGVYQSDRVSLANVTSSTMASLTANALNKRVMNMFQEYPHWWTPIVQEQDFASLQNVKWITLGGVGELPTVSEGATYTEMTWDDTYEEDTFVKKGGYLGLTIEAIDKDDTARLRAAPRALAQAAWLTLSKAIAALFTYSGTGGLGPDLEDSKAIFHADHSNYGTTALSWTAWNSTRQLMRDQTEVHSAEVLGALTAPRYLLVPNELEVTALQILASDGEPGTADNDINPWAVGASHDALIASARSRVIVVDFWTDANNWAAIADPRLYPTIGLGYRYGRAPELFSVASPTAGLMFSNDTMPIKVRFFYVLGAIDYRGMYLHKVT